MEAGYAACSLDADADDGFEVVSDVPPSLVVDVDVDGCFLKGSYYERRWKRFVAFALVVMWSRNQFGGLSPFTKEWAHFCPNPQKNKKVKGKPAIVEYDEDVEEV